MYKNKKYILIGISILIILILIVSITVAIKNNKKSKTKVEELESYNLNEVIDIENIENTKYKTEKIKSSEKVSPNYIIGDKSYKLNGNVKLGEKEGKMYFIREEHNKINLYKEKYRIDKYDSIATQVEGIINNFEENIKSYIGIEYNKKAKYENLDYLYFKNTNCLIFSAYF